MNRFYIVTKRGGGYYWRNQEYPGAYSWQEYEPRFAEIVPRTNRDLAPIRVTEDDDDTITRGGHTYQHVKSLFPGPAPDPPPFDPYGGREAPPWTY